MREFGGVRRRGGMGALLGLAAAQADRDGRQERRHATEHEDERDPAEPLGPERADRRTEQQPAHLDRAVQPERLAASLRRRRVGQVAARGRVVGRGRETGPGAQEEERERPGEDQRQHAEHTGRDEADDHQRDARGPVGQPAEDRFADEPGRRPGRDDEAEEGEVHALFGEVDGQDRQERAEAEPDDELGQEERDDVAPALGPGGETPDGRRVRHRPSLAADRILAGPRTRTSRWEQHLPMTSPMAITAEGLVKIYRSTQDTRSVPSTGSISRSPKAPSSVCSARTAPARRRPSASWPRSSGPTPGARPWPGSTSGPRPTRSGGSSACRANTPRSTRT